jgi:hypothetical protein
MSNTKAILVAVVACVVAIVFCLLGIFDVVTGGVVVTAIGGILATLVAAFTEKVL